MIVIYHNAALFAKEGHAQRAYQDNYCPKIDWLRAVALVHTDDVDMAYQLTNTIDAPWWTNATVVSLFTGDGCRSTSVGDVAVTEDGTILICAPAGWRSLTDVLALSRLQELTRRLVNQIGQPSAPSTSS